VGRIFLYQNFGLMGCLGHKRGRMRIGDQNASSASVNVISAGSQQSHGGQYLMKSKVRRCKICHKEFSQFNTLQKVCSVNCALEYSKQKSEKHRQAQAKSARRMVKEARDKLKSRNEYLKEAQSAFNAYIRARDHDQPCISCGRYHQGQVHAGHYRGTKATPELRFHPMNCFAQCQPCNTHLSGNIVEYRKNLLIRLGTRNLQWIEGPHRPQRYSIQDAKDIKAYFKGQMRRLNDDSVVDRPGDYS